MFLPFLYIIFNYNKIFLSFSYINKISYIFVIYECLSSTDLHNNQSSNNGSAVCLFKNLSIRSFLEVKNADGLPENETFPASKNTVVIIIMISFSIVTMVCFVG